MIETHWLDGCREAWAIGESGRTCVGTGRDYPLEHGNCMSMKTKGATMSALNVVAENIDELLRRGVISWPIRLLVIEEPATAIVADPRIPDAWYKNRLCEVCTPNHLLPVTQRLVHLLDIAAGLRVESVDSVVTSGRRRGEP